MYSKALENIFDFCDIVSSLYLTMIHSAKKHHIFRISDVLKVKANNH